MLNKRLKAKQNLSRFDRFIDANLVFTASVPFVQPANMRLAVSFSENILDNQVSVYVNTREIVIDENTLIIIVYENNVDQLITESGNRIAMEHWQ